ncbi:MAG TPA: class I SAM-dependent methyltransferase [Candidatus Eisenbacteria bacterium]
MSPAKRAARDFHATAGPEAVPDDLILGELVDMARRYPERGLLQFGGMVGAHQYRRLYRLLRSLVPEGATILDWGTGNGHFSYFVQRSGRKAAGFSLLDGAFRAWLPDPEYSFRQGDEADPVGLPYPDGAFDAVASVGVLEHVRETGGSEEGSLREIARVLKPGGVFVCYHFPNRWSVIDALARRVPGRHHHVYRYTRSDIVALALRSGLSLERVERYGILPRNFSARLPGALARSKGVAAAWDFVDGALAAPLSMFCQNYLFVARKDPKSNEPAIPRSAT